MHFNKSLTTVFNIAQPENLLLDSQGNLKISDFGLSASPGEVRSPKTLTFFLYYKKEQQY